MPGKHIIGLVADLKRESKFVYTFIHLPFIIIEVSIYFDSTEF